MSTQITLRRDTVANWTSVNPILDLAEVGVITDATEYTIKIGDGITVWNNLPPIVLGQGSESSDHPVININWENPGTTITTKTQARGLVPQDKQTAGIIIVYVDSSNNTHCEIYTNTSSTYSTADTYWTSLMSEGGSAPQWHQL